MESNSGRRHVEIFNFSFLDILACVIGLLIFILTVVVISGSAAASPRIRAQAAAMASSQQSLARAKTHAALAEQRKVAAQTLLESTAHDLGDATVSKEAVEKQTVQYNADADTYGKMDAEIQARINVLNQSPTTNAAAFSPQQIADAEGTTQKLNQESDQLKQADDKLAAQATVPKKEITFYVPRLRETSKTAFFIDVTHGRFFFVESDDFDQTPLLTERGTRYTRKATAAGSSIQTFVANPGSQLPPFVETNRNSIVLTFIVRPDGYEAFRHLREWAWKRGYAVNWSPSADDDPIILVPATHSWQQ